MELPNVEPPKSLSNEKTINSIPKGIYKPFWQYINNLKDETTRKKILDIIDHQFDLEIYLKQKEIATIKQEITNTENILSDLKQALKNGMFFIMIFY